MDMEHRIQTMTFRLHAPLDRTIDPEELVASGRLVPVTVDGRQFNARATKATVCHGAFEVDLWMDPTAGTGPTGPVLFTLDELGHSTRDPRDPAGLPHIVDLAPYDSCDA